MTKVQNEVYFELWTSFLNFKVRLADMTSQRVMRRQSCIVRQLFKFQVYLCEQIPSRILKFKVQFEAITSLQKLGWREFWFSWTSEEKSKVQTFSKHFFKRKITDRWSFDTTADLPDPTFKIKRLLSEILFHLSICLANRFLFYSFDE